MTAPLKISAFRNAKDNQPEADTMAWEDLCRGFDVRDTKDGLAWSPATFRGTRSTANVIELSCLVFDLDDELTEDLAKALEPYDYIVHSTYTPGRWRIIIRTSRPHTAREHANLWEHVQQAVGGAFDEACKDVARLYYWPSHPSFGVGESYDNGTAPPLDVDGVLRNAFPTHGILPVGRPSAPVVPVELPAIDNDALTAQVKAIKDPERRKLVLDFISPAWGPPEGERDVSLHKALSNFVAYVKPTPTLEVCETYIDKCVHYMETAPEGPAYWKQKAIHSAQRAIEYVKNRDEKEAATERAAKEKAGLDVSEDGSEEDWRAALHRKPGPDGEPKGFQSNSHNLALILQHDTRFRTLRLNTISRNIEAVDGPLRGYSMDSLDTALSTWLQGSEYKIKMSRSDCLAHLVMVAEGRPYDPVKQYLENLAPWDGVERISSALRVHCKVDNENTWYTDNVSRKFFIGLVARGLKPGTQVDSMLILSGKGGQGKTSFVRVLGGEFASETTLDLHSKDAQQATTGAWLMEMAELSSAKKAENELLKSFLTRTIDSFRPPYGKVIKQFPRRCCFVGTTNEEEFLQDTEGARRYWPVRTGKVDLAWLKENRGQLFAEAIVALNKGEAHYFSDEEMARVESETSLYQKSEASADEVALWFLKTAREKRPTEVTSNEMLKNIGIDTVQMLNTQAQKSMCRALKSLGFEHRRMMKGGRRFWVFKTPLDLLDGMQTKTGTMISPVPEAALGN